MKPAPKANTAAEGEGTPVSRRGFLASASAAAGSLLLPFHLPGARAAAPDQDFAPNAYLRLSPDGTVTIVVALVEMGQGTFTSIPMLIAEELELDWSQVRVAQAPADENRYANPLFGTQTTGGSTSIQAAWGSLRQVGATARLMLQTAAAQTWGVPLAECRCERGTVMHPPSGRSLDYGALAGTAAGLPMVGASPLKDPAGFRLVGTAVPRIDTPAKVDGSARFGIDVRLPGMKVAAIAICPVIGGRLGAVDGSKALAVAGVRRVLVAETAVAVVADHYGAAQKGLAAVRIQWEEGPSAAFSNEVWRRQLAEALKGRGQVMVDQGSVARASAAAARRHRAVYESPPLAHAAMEPLNCTIHARRDACEVWLGTQAPARVQSLVAGVLGLAPAQVTVHNHLIGGGFGRKLDADCAELAAQFAKQVDFPLKVVYSREQDIQHDAYRPCFRDELFAALDAKGRLVAFSHRTAGSSVIARYAPSWLIQGQDGDVAHTAETPYEVPNKYVEYVRHEPPAGLLTGFWRGVGPAHHAFPNECFIDELAMIARVDPLAFRSRMLSKNPRALAVLQLAATRAGWGTPLAARRGRGVAIVDAWGSYAALVSEVTVARDGSLAVDRMVCALDCGLAVHPDGIEAQVHSGLVYGLSAVLYGTLHFERGRVLQGNFHDYQVLRMHEMPVIEFHRVESRLLPGGIGEIGTALVCPSVMNAVHAATGRRFRSYPVPGDQLKAA